MLMYMYLQFVVSFFFLSFFNFILVTFTAFCL